MRDLFSKVMTGSMIAGAALLVTACGDENAEANNTATMEMNTMDPMMDGSTNDVTAIDAGTGADANMTMDSNTSMTANGSTTTNTTTSTDANMTNGM